MLCFDNEMCVGMCSPVVEDVCVGVVLIFIFFVRFCFYFQCEVCGHVLTFVVGLLCCCTCHAHVIFSTCSM